MKISDLSKNPDNPRTITEAKQRMLLKALRRFGDLSGIVYNRKTQQLVGGHQRRDIFDPATPITIVKKYSKPTKTGTVAEGFIEAKGERFSYREVFWDEHTERAANIAANKGAGEWDPARLGEWIKDLSGFDVDFDLDLTMFDADEIKDITGIEVKGYTRTNTKTGVDEDEVPEKAPPVTKHGDLYILGEHRLLCGDSTDQVQVQRAMDGDKADLWLTDPPYGVGMEAREKSSSSWVNKDRINSQVTNDDKSLEEMKVFWKACAQAAHSACSDKASYYWFACQGGEQMMMMMMMLGEGGWQVKHELIWVKDQMCFGRADYHYKHEPIIYGWKRKCTHEWCGDRSQVSTFEVPRPKKSDLHPTMKPIELLERLLENSSKANWLVLDTFGGSGSTLIACEKTGRKARLLEIDPHYCDVIVARWEKYTGLKAKLIRTETKTKRASQAKEHANGESESKASAQA